MKNNGFDSRSDWSDSEVSNNNIIDACLILNNPVWLFPTCIILELERTSIQPHVLNRNRKTEFPGYVETPPTRRSRHRKSTTPDVKLERPDEEESSLGIAGHVGDQVPAEKMKTKISTEANGTANGHSERKRVVDGWGKGRNPRVDYSGHFEFGGSWGVAMMMIGFPILMYIMWLGATYYDGHLPMPDQEESLSHFVHHLMQLVYEGAFPTAKAWIIYWTFLVFEAACYLLLPGVMAQGKPLPHKNGEQLKYWCSGVWSFYATIVVVTALHLSGAFKLYILIDEFGPLMSVAIISGFIVSFVAYFSALHRGVEHRMSGHLVYDFFMGAELNPRMFELLDFKMFFEVRIPWYILFLISCGAAARQYEQFGWVSGEVGFLVMAHFLYANACSKGEELIVTTW